MPISAVIMSRGVLAWRTERAPLILVPALMAPPSGIADDSVNGLEAVGLEVERLTTTHHRLTSEDLT